MPSNDEATNKLIKPQKRCGECGRITQHFHGMYDGLGFCCACYARVFIRKKCKACPKYFRIHPQQSFEYCKPCRPKMIPCFRCSRVNYPIGRYYNDKPVCRACAPNFKPERQCPRCGQYSAHMSKALDFGITAPICKRCISAYHQPCELCAKPRHPLKEKEGKRLCSKCYTFGLLDCPDCGVKYPSGLGRVCMDCNCRRRTLRKAQISKHLYENESTQEDVLRFAKWLPKHTTPLKASVSINNFHAFFKLVDEQPNDWYLDARALGSLDKSLLRKDGYARLFYESIGIVIPASVLEEVSIQRAIRAHVEFIYQTTPYPLCDGAKAYATHCRARYEYTEIKLRTLKQQLSAVVSLVKYLERCHRQLNQSSISEFLRHYPGLEASITGFLIFIDGPRPKAVISSKREHTSSKSILKAYLSQQNTETPPLKVIRAALHYLHRVPKALLSEVSMGHVHKTEARVFHVTIHGHTYTLDFNLPPKA